MSSRREHSMHTTGAIMARRGAAGAAERPPARYDPYVDGLFTYCLSVMCEHDAATAALGEALAVAERQCDRPQRAPRHGHPADTALYRPWLYALARWACLRRLTDQGRPERYGRSGAAVTLRRRELSSLAWPEAAGTTPEQREALELAVRHQLPVHEVAAILGMESDATRTLLSSGACEVERTRAALAVVESGGCPAVARLAGDHEVLLGTVLRRELVRHVDECADCRRTAERAMAEAPWPGTAPVGTSTLTVLEAPRPAVRAAVASALLARVLPAPRFDRRGFPVVREDRVVRRARLRSRVITTTVVATVVAAPALALWAAYRGAPFTGEGRDATSASTAEADGPGAPNSQPYENAGRADRTGSGPPDSPGTRRGGPGPEASATARETPDRAVADAGPGSGPTPYPGPGDLGGPGGGRARTGPGRITVDARPSGDATLITLTASGGSPVDWSAYPDAGWLRFSRTSGTLRPGESATVTVTVDQESAPKGRWSAGIRIVPANAVITIEGRGRTRAPSPAEQEPSPSEPAQDVSRSPSPS